MPLTTPCETCTSNITPLACYAGSPPEPYTISVVAFIDGVLCSIQIHGLDAVTSATTPSNECPLENKSV